eukprot:TRINITY_DN876_c0_g1_i3.p1 TRINITY_DN876_c0_g1~~TRINITY_DN876_c0_g1_i3.p1  ORF type:complete len:1190 (+),score=311.98 TRINITY_DN876_c0_g1_i3:321-3890(+)
MSSWLASDLSDDEGDFEFYDRPRKSSAASHTLSRVKASLSRVGSAVKEAAKSNGGWSSDEDEGPAARARACSRNASQEEAAAGKKAGKKVGKNGGKNGGKKTNVSAKAKGGRVGESADASRAEYDIFLKTITGRTATIRVSGGTSLAELQLKILDKLAVPVQQQRIVFGQKPLSDKSKTMADYGIGKEAMVMLILAMRTKVEAAAEEVAPKGPTMYAADKDTFASRVRLLLLMVHIATWNALIGYRNAFYELVASFAREAARVWGYFAPPLRTAFNFFADSFDALRRALSHVWRVAVMGPLQSLADTLRSFRAWVVAAVRQVRAAWCRFLVDPCTRAWEGCVSLYHTYLVSAYQAYAVPAYRAVAARVTTALEFSARAWRGGAAWLTGACDRVRDIFSDLARYLWQSVRGISARICDISARILDVCSYCRERVYSVCRFCADGVAHVAARVRTECARAWQVVVVHPCNTVWHGTVQTVRWGWAAARSALRAALLRPLASAWDRAGPLVVSARHWLAEWSAATLRQARGGVELVRVYVAQPIGRGLSACHRALEEMTEAVAAGVERCFAAAEAAATWAWAWSARALQHSARSSARFSRAVSERLGRAFDTAVRQPTARAVHFLRWAGAAFIARPCNHMRRSAVHLLSACASIARRGFRYGADLVYALWRGVRSAADACARASLDAWQASLRYVSDTFSLCLDAVRRVLSAAAGAVGVRARAAVEGAGDLVRWVREVVQRGVRWALDVVRPAMEWVRDGVSAVLRCARDVVHWALRSLGDAARPVVAAASSAVQAVLRAIGDAVQWGVQSAGDVVQWGVQSAGDVVRPAVEWVRNAVRWGAQSVGDVLHAAMDALRGVAHAVLRSVWDAVEGAVAWARGALVPHWRAVSEAVRGRAAALYASAAALAGAATQWGVQSVRNVLEALRGQWDAAVAWVCAIGAVRTAMSVLWPRRGVCVGGFALDVRPGTLRAATAEDASDVHAVVHVRDGTPYTVWLRNEHKLTYARCDLLIDGKEMGSFFLDADAAYGLDRPAAEARRFIFVAHRPEEGGGGAGGGGGGVAEADAGVVEARFMKPLNREQVAARAREAALRRRRKLQRILPQGSSSAGEFSEEEEEEFGDEVTVDADDVVGVGADDIGGVGAREGGAPLPGSTVLGGECSQKLRAPPSYATEPMDEEGAVVISIRMLALVQ